MLKKPLSMLTAALVVATAGALHGARPPAMAANVPVGDPLGLSYQQVFGDEFNGTSIDRTRWGLQSGWVANNVQLKPAACSESGGSLVLSAGCQPDSAGGSPGFRLARGEYVESRDLLPADSNGVCANWDAAWTASDADWPQGGELDYAEVLNPAAMGWGSTGSNVYATVIGNDENHRTGPFMGSWCGSWHVFGVYRGGAGDNNAYFFYDGNLVAITPTNDGGHGMGLTFTAGIGMGNTVSTPMLVDWVRAYRPVATPTPQPAPLPTPPHRHGALHRQAHGWFSFLFHRFFPHGGGFPPGG